MSATSRAWICRAGLPGPWRTTTISTLSGSQREIPWRLSLRVTILGAGYVGLVTGVGLAAAGHTVVCVDSDQRKIDAIDSGRPPFHEPGLDGLLVEQMASRRFSASSRLVEALRGSDVSIIAVGT